jgi:hypothetical protein
MGFPIIINRIITKDVNRNRNGCTIKHLLHNYLNNKMFLSLPLIYNPGMFLKIPVYVSICLIIFTALHETKAAQKII